MGPLSDYTFAYLRVFFKFGIFRRFHFQIWSHFWWNFTKIMVTFCCLINPPRSQNFPLLIGRITTQTFLNPQLERILRFILFYLFHFWHRNLLENYMNSYIIIQYQMWDLFLNYLWTYVVNYIYGEINQIIKKARSEKIFRFRYGNLNFSPIFLSLLKISFN